LSSYFTDTPFDKFLIFDLENKFIKKITFSDKKIGAPIEGYLKSIVFDVFDRKELSLFDYSLVNFDKEAKAYRLYNFLIATKAGETLAYSEVAENIFGFSRYARAVARMLNANPFTFFVPCHRVVAKNGIGGYAEGVELKLKILRWEGVSKF
jgi:methylated-DNA-[protein]-cysteine S-methyltransferase